MTVLVTGGAGFVGLNLVEALLARAEEVVLFDSRAIPPAADWALARHAARLTFVKGDVRDAAAIERAFSARRIERVAHCAAVTSGAEREAREPATIVAVNVHGTINVLEAARKHGVGRVVVTSSGAVYGVYNLSSGMDWSGCVSTWCEALQSGFPKFRFRVVAEGEEPNISYTDRDRGWMDLARLAQDVGFRPRFGSAEAYADYLEWLKRTPDFWERNE